MEMHVCIGHRVDEHRDRKRYIFPKINITTTRATYHEECDVHRNAYEIRIENGDTIKDIYVDDVYV